MKEKRYRAKTLEQILENDSKLLHKELYEGEQYRNQKEFERLQELLG